MRQRQSVAAQHPGLGSAPWQLVTVALVGVFVSQASASASAFQHASMPDPVTLQDCLNCEQVVAGLQQQTLQCRSDIAKAITDWDTRIQTYKDNIAQHGVYGDKVPTGQEACEGHDFDKAECDARGCCHFDVQGDVCMSKVGTGQCPQVPGADLQADVTNLQDQQDQLYKDIASVKYTALIQARERPKFLQQSRTQRASPLEDEKEGADFWAFHATKISRTKEECSILINPMEYYRSYSSIYKSSQHGTGYARSMLDSEQGWSAAQPVAGEYLIMDIGQSLLIGGVVTQSRADMPWEYVTGYTVEISLDGSSWTALSGLYHSGPHGGVVQMFPSPVQARYVKIVCQTYNAWMSMRAGVLACEAATKIDPLVDRWLKCKNNQNLAQQVLDACNAQKGQRDTWNEQREQQYSTKINSVLEANTLEPDFRIEYLRARKDQLTIENARLQNHWQAPWSCAASYPTSGGTDEENCNNGNTLNNGLEYLYNKGYTSTTAGAAGLVGCGCGQRKKGLKSRIAR